MEQNLKIRDYFEIPMLMEISRVEFLLKTMAMIILETSKSGFFLYLVSVCVVYIQDKK